MKHRMKTEHRSRTAAEWFVKLDSAAMDAATAREFEAWLVSDSAHGADLQLCNAAMQIAAKLDDDPELRWAFDEVREVGKTDERRPAQFGRWLTIPSLASGLAAVLVVGTASLILRFVARERAPDVQETPDYVQGMPEYVSPHNRSNVPVESDPELLGSPPRTENDSLPAVVMGRPRGDPNAEPGERTTNLFDQVVNFHMQRGEFADAERLLRDAIDAQRSNRPAENLDLARTIDRLAAVLQAQDHYDELERLLHEALAICTVTLGDADPLTIEILMNLASLYGDQEGRTTEALDVGQRALAAYRSVYGSDGAQLAGLLGDLGRWLIREGEYRAAESYLAEALAIKNLSIPSLFDDLHPGIANAQVDMAELLLATDRAGEALKLTVPAAASLEANFGPYSWRSAWARILEGASLSALQRFAEAEPLLLNGYEVLKAARMPNGAKMRRQSRIDASLRYLADLYATWGRPEEAAVYRELLE